MTFDMRSRTDAMTYRAAPHFKPPASMVSEPVLGGTVFHQHWWLSAATGGQFQEATVTAGNRVIGRLPYVIRRQMGFTEIRMPPFTHLLGPVADAGTGKSQTRILRRLSTVRALIDQLPPADFFKQALGACTLDGLAFQDRGYRVSTQYNFEIDCRVDMAALWEGMHFKTRQHIRRAEEKFEIATIDDPEAFVRFYLANLRKYGLTSSTDFSVFPKLFAACEARDSGEILCAQRPGGAPVAMVYLVWGHGVMYYLLSTRSRDADDNGSVNLLLWWAMRRAHDRALRLDLDGVSTSGTARFLSGFGGQLTLRTIVQRSRAMYGALQFAKRTILRGKANETLAFT